MVKINDLKMEIGKLEGAELLAKELKEKGIACSWDEARQKAEDIIRATENKKQEPDEQIQIMEQRYKFLLNSQNEKFSEDINILKNTLSSVSSELLSLKRQFDEQNKTIKQQEQRIEQKPKAEIQQKMQAEEKKKISSKGKIENEGLNPEDFAVDKIFYCGVK